MTRTSVASSHLNILSGRREDQARKRESESLHVTIQEAARRCGVNPKTIQRAIRAGALPAQYPKPNRCEIAVSDLNSFMPGHVQTATQQCLTEQVSGHVQTEMEQRVAGLEQRVQQLEHLIAALQDRPTVPKSLKRSHVQERTTGPLPKQFVSLLAFAEFHCVAESKVQTHADMGMLPVRRGEWTDADGTQVTLALDAKGRAAFFQIYQGVPPFVECGRCPH